MNNKYLPIGSVCTLKNGKTNIMIVGCYSTNYNYDIQIFDYKGCLYPEGITLSDQFFSFNSEDIDSVVYYGYSSPEHDQLINKIYHEDNKKEEETPVEDKNLFSNIENAFSENKFIVEEENQENGNFKFLNTEYLFGNNEEFKDEIITEPEEKKDDEHTFVNDDVAETDEANETVNVEEELTPEVESNYNKPENEYEFDESGRVIGLNGDIEKDDEISEWKYNDPESNYEFDDSDLVVDLNGKNEEEITPKDDEIVEVSYDDPDEEYTFDDNGVIIPVDEITEN